ncbi:DUF4416 family protein, partial [Candidatus Nomurabacteria bacterium]|nr:DUF4416 family protein [Candidatus Nomurabacteria bacterium]
GKRIINIDIGYIALPRLVLSTFKDFSHRIYLSVAEPITPMTVLTIPIGIRVSRMPEAGRSAMLNTGLVTVNSGTIWGRIIQGIFMGIMLNTVLIRSRVW